MSENENERENVRNWNIWTGKFYILDQSYGTQPVMFNQLHNTHYFNTTLFKFLFNMTCFSQYQ